MAHSHSHSHHHHSDPHDAGHFVNFHTQSLEMGMGAWNWNAFLMATISGLSTGLGDLSHFPKFFEKNFFKTLPFCCLRFNLLKFQFLMCLRWTFSVVIRSTQSKKIGSFIELFFWCDALHFIHGSFT
jgi:hypothetical protein